MAKKTSYEEIKLRAEQLNEIFDLTGKEIKKILRLYGASQREFGEYIGKSASTVSDLDNGSKPSRRIQQELSMFVGGLEYFLSLKKKIRGVL